MPFRWWSRGRDERMRGSRAGWIRGAGAARDEVRGAGLGVLDDQDVGAVGLPDDVGGDHGPWRAARGELTAGDQVHGVAEQRGQAEVVDRGQHRDAERRDKLEDLDLVADVEVIGRLVQDQVIGALGDGLGDQHPLLFAAGQRVEAAVRQVLTAADLGHGLFRDGAVGLVVAVEGPLVRGPADHDDLGDGEVEFEGEFLGHHRDPAGGVPGPHRQQVRAVEEHPPGRRAVDPVDGLEDRGLPASVRPEQPGEAAVGDGEADAGDDPPAADVDREVLQFQAHPVAPYR